MKVLGKTFISHREIRPISFYAYALNRTAVNPKQSSPSYGICDSEHNKAILGNVVSELKKKNPRFAGEDMAYKSQPQNKGTYGFKVSELNDFQAEITKFNQNCDSFRKQKSLHKPSLPWHDSKDPNYPFLKKEYDLEVAKFEKAQRAITTDIAKLFDSKLGWLLVTKSMRTTIGFEGSYGSPESFCNSGTLKMPGPQSAQAAINDFQTLQLKEVAIGLETKKQKSRWPNDVYANNNNRTSLALRIQSNPSSIASVLAENPKPEFAKCVCDQVKSIYSLDENNATLDKVMIGGSVIVGGALMASGVGAPIGAGMISVLGMADATLTGITLIDTYSKYNAETKISDQLASSASVGNISTKSASIQMLESEDRKSENLISGAKTAGGLILAGGAGLTASRRIASESQLVTKEATQVSKSLETELVITSDIRKSSDYIKTAKKAQDSIGGDTPLTTTELDKIYRGHLIGRGKIGKDGTYTAVENYKFGHIKKKYAYMKDEKDGVSFDRAKIQKLMDDGVIGDERIVKTTDQLLNTPIKNVDELAKIKDVKAFEGELNDMIDTRNRLYIEWKLKDPKNKEELYRQMKKYDIALEDISYYASKKLGIKNDAYLEMTKKPNLEVPQAASHPVASSAQVSAPDPHLTIKEMDKGSREVTESLDPIYQLRDSSDKLSKLENKLAEQKNLLAKLTEAANAVDRNSSESRNSISKANTIGTTITDNIRKLEAERNSTLKSFSGIRDEIERIHYGKFDDQTLKNSRNLSPNDRFVKDAVEQLEDWKFNRRVLSKTDVPNIEKLDPEIARLSEYLKDVGVKGY